MCVGDRSPCQFAIPSRFQTAYAIRYSTRCARPKRCSSRASYVFVNTYGTAFMQLDRPMNPTERVLMGPGPSTVPQRVLRALAAPTLGHLDPEYLAIMDETRQ